MNRMIQLSTKAAAIAGAAIVALASASCGNNNSQSPGGCSTQAPSGGAAFVGSVDLGYSVTSSGTNYNASATFHPNYGGAAASSSAACPGAQIGVCCFVPQTTACPFPSSVSAGAITVSDGSTLLGQIPYSDGYGDLSSSSSNNVAWHAGDTLNVSAPGAPGFVNSFMGSVVVPADLTGISPAAIANGTALTIPKSHDFVVSWTPGTGTSQVVLYLSDITLEDIACKVPVTAGTITVSSTLLQMLGSGGSLTLAPFATGTATDSNATLSVEADGTFNFSSTTYQ